MGSPTLWQRLRVLSGQDWLALVPACAELARARMRLQTINAKGFHTHPLAAFQTDADARHGRRIGLAVSRAARIVPWRSDCLVQAEAARHWLARLGIDSDIRLGARKTGYGTLDAHAWLISRGQVVTGGDISDFTPFEGRKDADVLRAKHRAAHHHGP